MITEHIPVMLDQVIENLEIKPFGVYVDCTLGGGGYSNRILSLINTGKLYSFDIDKDAIKVYSSENDKKDNHVLVNASFVEIEKHIKEDIDGIVADLGWSTDQLKSVPGLSFMESSSLDMRYDSTSPLAAVDYLNLVSKADLLKAFMENSNINYHVANALVKEIKSNIPVANTELLNNIITSVSRKDFLDKKLASQVYQAIRIEVNREYENIKDLINSSNQSLKDGGVLLIVTFHSGEEQIVRDSIKNSANLELSSTYRPTVQELRQNLSARSAKLWKIIKQIKN